MAGLELAVLWQFWVSMFSGSTSVWTNARPQVRGLLSYFGWICCHSTLPIHLKKQWKILMVPFDQYEYIQLRLSFCFYLKLRCRYCPIFRVCFPLSPAAKDTAWPLGIPHEVRQLPLGRGSWKLFWSTTILQGFFCALRLVTSFIVPCKRCKMMVSFRRGWCSPHNRCWGLVNVKIGMIPNLDETFRFGWALNGWRPITFEQTKTSEFLTRLTWDSRMKLPQFKGRWLIDPVLPWYTRQTWANTTDLAPPSK